MVERNEVDQMKKIMQAFNGGGGMSGDTGVGGNAVSPAPLMTGDQNVAEMKSILEKFYSATGNVISEALMDRNLRESLAMEETEHGARIGNWEIIVNEVGKRRQYDVANVMTGEKIADNLMIYEAAAALARHLNDAGTINSTPVVEMLRAECQYAGAVQDMTLFKHRLTKTPKGPRAGIYEARYSAAKQKAILSRDRVLNLSERL
jgi:hypothetical protein